MINKIHMTAQDAYDKAQEYNIRSTGAQYIKIIAKIDDAAESGEYHTTIFEHILQDVCTSLESDGFVVTSTTDCDGTRIRIDWNVK